MVRWPSLTEYLINDISTNATYEYGPFGEPICASGTMAKANPIRWSTKYTDEETDLVYYGYRYYSTSLGRWLGIRLGRKEVRIYTASAAIIPRTAAIR